MRRPRRCFCLMGTMLVAVRWACGNAYTPSGSLVDGGWSGRMPLEVVPNVGESHAKCRGKLAHIERCACSFRSIRTCAPFDVSTRTVRCEVTLCRVWHNLPRHLARLSMMFGMTYDCVWRDLHTVLPALLVMWTGTADVNVYAQKAVKNVRQAWLFAIFAR